MEKDPHTRYTAVQALEHVWLSDARKSWKVCYERRKYDFMNCLFLKIIVF